MENNAHVYLLTGRSCHDDDDDDDDDTCDRDALLKMQEVYKNNTALGDPASLNPQLEENARTLDQLQKNVTKYQVTTMILVYQRV